jgi:hypothetical protein
MDAVVVYRIFGLDLDATFALVRVLVTLVVIFFTIRIPFKRNYHWMFLVVSIVILWHSFFNFYDQLATNAADLPIGKFTAGPCTYQSSRPRAFPVRGLFRKP